MKGLLILGFLVYLVYACSDFVLFSGDNSSILALRTLDFPQPMNAQLLVFPRGQSCSSTAPDGTKGLSWVSNWGFVGINGFYVPNLILEGMNEVGLTCGYLTLEVTEYPTLLKSQYPNAMALSDLALWVLGMFSSVEEVYHSLMSGDAYIWGDYSKPLQQVPLIHIAVHDSWGQNLVIEFVGGQMQIYNNTLGILTNDPPLPFHMYNIALYGGIYRSVVPEFTVGPNVIRTFIETSFNVPGGFSPADRFVRVMTLLRYVSYNFTDYDPLIIGTMILNSVSIPPGIIQASVEGEWVTVETQWSTIKDTTNRIFYFRSTDGLIQAIDLNALDLSQNYQPFNISCPTPFIQNVTLIEK